MGFRENGMEDDGMDTCCGQALVPNIGLRILYERTDAQTVSYAFI